MSLPRSAGGEPRPPAPRGGALPPPASSPRLSLLIMPRPPPRLPPRSVALVDEAGTPVDTLHTDGSGERRATSARRVPTHDALPPPPPPLTAPPPRLSAPAAAVAVEVRHSGSQELHQRIKRNQWGSFFQARAWGGGGMGARAGGRTARRRGVHMRRPAPPLLPANTPQCPCHLSDLPAQQVGRQLEEEGSRGRCRSSSCRRADLVARAALPRALPLAHHPFIPSHLLRSAHCHLPRLLCHPPPPPFRRPTPPAPPPRGRAPAQRHVTTI